MSWGQLLDITSKFLTSLAVLLGAGWVLFNYFAGRTHRPRLQLRVSGERVLRDGLEYLLVRAELSNVGLARVKLVNKGCVTTVFAHELPDPPPIVMKPKWRDPAEFDLFKDQQWVEPSGLLVDQQVIALPGLKTKFVKIWAHVESKRVAWNAESVIASLP